MLARDVIYWYKSDDLELDKNQNLGDFNLYFNHFG